MTIMLILVAMLVPVVGGFILPLLKIKENEDKKRNSYAMFVVICTSILVLLLVLSDSVVPLSIITINLDLQIQFFVDGLSKIFLVLIAVLWPIATLYSFEYMHHDTRKNKFYTFFISTYGVVIGLACSANLITFYLMYEMLTFITLPLVMHTMKNKDVKAGRKYVAYSITGASLAFVGIMIVYVYGSSLDFIYGGVDFVNYATHTNTILLGYLLCFFGFGVKAAVFPFHQWLPVAGVAPTPVTALLHAVAVVKAGVFGIARVTFYSFGPSLLIGTYAQDVAMIFAAFTIVFGSVCAYKEVHLKRRLAYSTVSNLSYIVFGITLMTPLGLAAAMAHMLFHGIIKICLFFCAGAVIEIAHLEYLSDIEGLAKKMPLTFISFTIGALALSGIPLFAGFISKYSLANAAVSQGTILSYIGVGALLISAVLTAYYTLEVSVTAFIKKKENKELHFEKAHDPSWLMILPFALLCIMMVALGIQGDEVIKLLTAVAQGLV